jgi:predicted HicB family RNase H-like nuclease
VPKKENSSWDPNKYNKENYERISVVVPKGSRERIKEAAAADGQSVNRYILEAVEQRSGLALTLDNSLPQIAEARGYDTKREKWQPTPAAENATESTQEAAGAILAGGVVCLTSEEEKSAQNVPEAENGRTACSVKSEIYEAAAVAAGKKSVSINDFVDKWVKIGADETEKIIRLSGNMHKPLQIEKPKEAPYPAPKKKTEEPKPAYVWHEDGTPTTWAEIFEREGWNKPKNKSAGE